jgi:hypothetical protein
MSITRSSFTSAYRLILVPELKISALNACAESTDKLIFANDEIIVMPHSSHNINVLIDLLSLSYSRIVSTTGGVLSVGFGLLNVPLCIKTIDARNQIPECNSAVENSRLNKRSEWI